jgi:hypothetical protein
LAPQTQCRFLKSVQDDPLPVGACSSELLVSKLAEAAFSSLVRLGSAAVVRSLDAAPGLASQQVFCGGSVQALSAELWAAALPDQEVAQLQTFSALCRAEPVRAPHSSVCVKEQPSA